MRIKRTERSFLNCVNIPQDIALSGVTEYTVHMNYFSWAKLALGLWVFLSPWVLGFAGYPLALWSNVLSGAGIVVIMLWSIFNKKSEVK